MGVKEVLRIVHPAEIFNVLNIKNFDEANKVLKGGFDFLLYMRAGDCLCLGETIKFNKIRSDLFQIESDISPEILTDSLIKRRVVKIPG